MAEEKTFEFRAKFTKVDDDLGLVFCWGMICKIAGEEYFDTQDDHIPEEAMLEALTNFMLESQIVKEMHQGGPVGQALFAFPLTEDIMKAYGITCDRTGAMIAIKPSSEEVLEKFRNGTYTGISIGGRRITDEEID